MLTHRAWDGRAKGWARWSWLVVGWLMASAAGADWLITLQGRLIETQGPWTIEGDILTYTDLEGEEHTFHLDDLDLEASEETTAIKLGKPYVPRKRPSEEADSAPTKKGKKKSDQEEPKIILYTDAFCPNCSAAREQLQKLGVDFVEKSISQDWKAAREYKKKAGRGGGLPLIDVDGTLVFNYHPRVVKQRIEEYLEKQAEQKGDD